MDEDPNYSSAESLVFDSETLRIATGNFCDANKLGEGGFGPVYQVILLGIIDELISVTLILSSGCQFISILFG